MALKPLELLPETPLKIQRALLSVSDKSGLIPLAKSLAAQGVELISTGGTANAIRESGLEVKDVSEITGFPECLDGRVKTLHPYIHGGILGRTSHTPDLEELRKLEIRPIELVVVNLYPFKETIARSGVTPSVATENIDIGGPTMIRAAAKNFAHVCILSDPAQYSSFTDELEQHGTISYDSRLSLATAAFEQTADYDAAISRYYSNLMKSVLPKQLTVSYKQSAALRYGENPHQPAAVYGDQSRYIDCFHGKELSYNNYLDIDAALNLISDFRSDGPTLAIFKHTVPCGVATSEHLNDAWKKAFSTDTVSPFGGIVIMNCELDLETAREIDGIFTEIVLAPSYSQSALELLKKKKNRRLIRILEFPSDTTELQFRSITGGALVQRMDREPLDESELQSVTRRKPDENEMADLRFAWKVVKHVKSNAIVYVKNGQTLGIGTGQTSRVDSSEIAIRKAKKEGLDLQGCVVASDAFFPFADGIEAAAEAGAVAAIQPGGSIRDQEVIQAADNHNMAMVFTGTRYFKH